MKMAKPRLSSQCNEGIDYPFEPFLLRHSCKVSNGKRIPRGPDARRRRSDKVLRGDSQRDNMNLAGWNSKQFGHACSIVVRMYDKCVNQWHQSLETIDGHLSIFGRKRVKEDIVTLQRDYDLRS